MFTRATLPMILFVLCGCVSEGHLIPDGYDGGLASINDTYERRRQNKVHLFYVSSIDGKRVPNGAIASDKLVGSASFSAVQGYSREVQAKSLALELRGHPKHAMLIADVMTHGGNDQLEGEVELNAQAGSFYRVRGHLSNEYSALWVEDEHGRQVSDLIEKYDDSNENALQLRSALLLELETNAAPDASERTPRHAFASIAIGQSGEFIRRRFGEPDSVVKHPPNIFMERPAMETHSYHSLGVVRYVRGRAGKLYVHELLQSYSDQKITPDSLRRELNTIHGQQLVAAIKKYHQAGIAKPELLDVFAEKLENTYATKDRFVADGMAYICRILGENSPGTYDALLEMVSREARYRAIRRHAKANLSPTTAS